MITRWSLASRGLGFEVKIISFDNPQLKTSFEYYGVTVAIPCLVVKLYFVCSCKKFKFNRIFGRWNTLNNYRLFIIYELWWYLISIVYWVVTIESSLQTTTWTPTHRRLNPAQEPLPRTRCFRPLNFVVFIALCSVLLLLFFRERKMMRVYLFIYLFCEWEKFEINFRNWSWVQFIKILGFEFNYFKRALGIFIKGQQNLARGYILESILIT